MLAWFLSARAAQVLTRVAAIGCLVGSFSSVAILVLLGLRGHPLPELFPLYALPIVTLVLGQLVAMAWAAARSSASEGRAFPRSMRFGSGGDFFHDIFGPALPRRATGVFMAFFFLAIACAAACMLIVNMSDHPVGREPSCAYSTNDHGTRVCITAFQSAALQGIAPAIFFGFNVLQLGSAVGGVLQQRAFGAKPRR